MLKHIIPFFQFYVTAATVYQVHSPYLYEIVDKTVENPNYRNGQLPKLLQQKNKYNEDDRLFQVVDFGARSKVQQAHEERKIGDFSKQSSSGQRILAFFYYLSELIKPNRFLELGAGLGFSSAAVGLGHDAVKITTIEGNPHLAPFTKENIGSLGVEAEVIGTTIEDFLSSAAAQGPWDIIFNDGNHTYEAALNYFNFFKDKMSPDGIFIMDDIRWSSGMWQAWQEIRKMPEVTASIDLYTLGVLFFNPDLIETFHHKMIPSSYKPWKKLVL